MCSQLTTCLYPNSSVSIYHKVRGGKGEWKEVSLNENIRVTKGVGKKIRLLVRSPISFKQQDIRIQLVDISDVGGQHKDTSKFVVETLTIKSDGSGRYQGEYILKLYRLSKNIYFQITFERHILPQLQSVMFNTHNSGKQKYALYPLQD